MVSSFHTRILFAQYRMYLIMMRSFPNIVSALPTCPQHFPHLVLITNTTQSPGRPYLTLIFRNVLSYNTVPFSQYYPHFSGYCSVFSQWSASFRQYYSHARLISAASRLTACKPSVKQLIFRPLFPLGNTRGKQDVCEGIL